VGTGHGHVQLGHANNPDRRQQSSSFIRQPQRTVAVPRPAIRLARAKNRSSRW
jgi:hypothetical protein